jgi:hypothetical protein
MKLIQFFEAVQDNYLAQAIYNQLVHGDWSEAEGYQADHLLDEIEQQTGQDLENPSDFNKILRFIKNRYLDPGRFSQAREKVQQLRSGGPFEAYRGMSLSVSDQEALFGNGVSQDSQGGSQVPVGRFWTWDPKVAKEMIGGRGKNFMILHGRISPDAVDWLNTLAANAIWGESEIRLKGGRIELLDVLDAFTGKSVAKPRDDVEYISEQDNPYDFALKTKWSTMDVDLVKWLRAQGFKKLGSGVYGEAFHHASFPDKIIKVVYEDDPCFLAYLRYLVKNQGNPHVPKYYGAKQIPLRAKDKGYGGFGTTPRRRFFVIIEKLRPMYPPSKWHMLNWGNGEEGYINFCGFLAFLRNWAYAGDFSTAFVAMKSGKKMSFYGQLYATELTDFVVSKDLDFRYRIAMKLIKKGEASLKNQETLFLRTLVTIYKSASKGCEVDLHFGNFMIRPNTGDIVVTDPYA